MSKITIYAGYAVGNLDATVLCQKPKLAPYIGSMREKIAAVCGVSAEQVSVKATTEEKLGFTECADLFAIFPRMVQNVFAQNCVAVVFLVSILLNLVLPKNMEAEKVTEQKKEKA